ncbi:MAG: Gldg family protein [Planctomycetota bacterium]|nr:Gldg family protein [Planctomycetota bacterium]
MKRAAVATIVLAVALVACALVLARIVAAPGGNGIELGRARVASVEPALRARVARGDLDILVQWFGPAEAERPAGYDGVEADVRAAFAALERAAPGRVRTQILRPDTDPEARRHAEALGLAPFRARRIVRDGWTDVPVWSALRTVVAGRGASVVRALTPELADGTQGLIAAGIAEIEAPRRARIALSAPPGHARLRALLRELGDVTDIDFDTDVSLPPDVDLLVWIAPARVEAPHVARLRSFVDRGGSAFVAADRFHARVEGEDLVLEPAAAAGDALYADLGLALDASPLLEAPPAEAAGSGATWTWHVARSIGSRQDFRALSSQPNGTIAFQAPTALSPDAARLRATGSTFTSLATSSDRCFRLPAGAGSDRVRIADLARGGLGAAEPPRALLALVAPEDPTRGSVVVAASAAPFGDRGLADANFVHEELVRVLVRGLASTERRALATVARARPAPLPEATSAERWTARALCIALVPLVLLAVGLARGALSLRDFTGRAFLLPALGILACAAVGLVAFAIPARAGLDLSAASVHGLPPELLRIAADAAGEGASITAAVSDGAALPPDLRPLARELAARCERVARATPGLGFRELAPDAIGAAEHSALGIRRLERTSTTDESRSTQSFFATLVVERGTQRRVLDFPDAESFRHADFRLALALRDVALGRSTVVAFASEPARVTPAESLELYQRRGLFAPGTGDPFAAARALLARNGFEVQSLDFARAQGGPDGERLSDTALLVWMQPRRDATAGARQLARHLAAGGRALVAAQQNRIRPRVRSDRAGDAALWPEPLFPDLDRLWLPALGLRLAPELVLDTQSGVLRTEGTRERGGRVESVAMDLANPLVVRSTPADRPVTPFTAGVGDLLLPSPTRILVDRDVLRRANLTATTVLATSDGAWTAPWTGGDVPAAAFQAPAGPRAISTLGVLVEGAFPGPSADPALGIPDEVASSGVHRGRLVLVGASEPFTDANLGAAGADHARLLLQTCAALALPEEYATLLAREPSVGGYRALEPAERIRARAITIAAGPALILLLAFGWRTWRGRRHGLATARSGVAT